MKKIGLIGIGHLGKIHLKCIQLIGHVDLVGIYDVDSEAAIKIAEAHSTRAFENLDDLLDAVDMVDIVTPTFTHYDIARQAIAKGKHVFIEKPITQTVEEAEALRELQEKHKVKVQVGHVERFNPAFLSLQDFSLDPMFIEAHRLALFNPRGTDVSVVFDLMIHDLDILLYTVKSEVKLVQATGVSIVSNTPDIANARIEFENGCVAIVTASRMSIKNMRKVRLFQKDAYISLDFLEKKAQIIRMFDEEVTTKNASETMMELDTAKGKKWISIQMPDVESVNAIKMEIETFIEAIEHDTTPKVTLNDGLAAIKLAYEIDQQILSKENQLLSKS